MSITIKLDAPALRALIDDDAEFKLELQRSVVSEVIRNTVLKDVGPTVKREFEDYVSSFFAKGPSYGSLVLKPAQKAALTKEFAAAASAEMTNARLEAVGALKLYLAEQLPVSVKDSINTHMAREIDRQVAERIAAVMAGLAK